MNTILPAVTNISNDLDKQVDRNGQKVQDYADERKRFQTAEAFQQKSKQDKTESMENNVKIMDYLSLIIFPLAFVLFNVIYWPTYL